MDIIWSEKKKFYHAADSVREVAQSKGRECHFFKYLRLIFTF